MSKAFTREDAPSEEPSHALAQLEDDAPRAITADGLLALQQERDSLDAERLALTLATDLASQARLRELRSRLLVLDHKLRRAVVPDAPSEPDRISFGARVTVRDAHERTRTLRIVSADEVDAARGLVSAHSPLARALLGARVGDTLEVELPRGAEELTVIAIHDRA